MLRGVLLLGSGVFSTLCIVSTYRLAGCTQGLHYALYYRNAKRQEDEQNSEHGRTGQKQQ